MSDHFYKNRRFYLTLNTSHPLKHLIRRPKTGIRQLAQNYSKSLSNFGVENA